MSCFSGISVLLLAFFFLTSSVSSITEKKVGVEKYEKHLTFGRENSEQVPAALKMNSNNTEVFNGLEGSGPINLSESLSPLHDGSIKNTENQQTTKQPVKPRKGVQLDSDESESKSKAPKKVPPTMKQKEKTKPEKIKPVTEKSDKIVTENSEKVVTEKSIDVSPIVTLNVSTTTEKTNSSVPTAKVVKHKKKPLVTIGESKVDGKIPASPKKSSPAGMPRKMDYVIPAVITIFALPLLAVASYVMYKRGRDCWDKRHYRRMDFLIDGMYNE